MRVGPSVPLLVVHFSTCAALPGVVKTALLSRDPSFSCCTVRCFFSTSSCLFWVCPRVYFCVGVPECVLGVHPQPPDNLACCHGCSIGRGQASTRTDTLITPHNPSRETGHRQKHSSARLLLSGVWHVVRPRLAHRCRLHPPTSRKKNKQLHIHTPLVHSPLPLPAHHLPGLERGSSD